MKRKALLTSVLALLLCVSMLVGTTFAWFTDSVSNGVNKIVSGNLDVELWHKTFNEAGYMNMNDYAPVEADTELFLNIDGEEILWEPGACADEYFKVTNNGSLALKYKFTIDFANATETPEGKTLADVLSIYAVYRDFPNMNDSPVEGYDQVALKNFEFESYLLPGESHEFQIGVEWKPSDVDNEFNVKGGLSIDLGVNLVATQYTYEKDATGDQYDVDAEYPVVYNAASADALNNAIANAQPNDVIQLVEGVDYGTITLNEELTGVTIIGAEETDLLMDIGADAVLTDVVFKNLDLQGYNGTGSYKGAINVLAGADVDITFENCTFAPNSGYSGVRVYEPTAELSFIGCTFIGGRYGVYDSGAPIAKAEFIDCSFNGQSSWTIQFNGSGTDSVITIDGCTFDGTNGGIIKVLGAPTAGSTFTFTDNTVTNSRGHDGKESEWFSISSVYEITCSGNTKDGADWAPAAAQGLGK